MPGPASRAAAIVGAAEANEIGYPSTPKTSLGCTSRRSRTSATWTGIPISAIDGIFSAGWSPQLAEYLGLHPKYIDTTSVGGCSFEMHVHHALCAIHAGVIDVALVSHGEMGWNARHTRGRGTGARFGGGGDPWDPAAQHTSAYGLGGAPTSYSHALNRHMHRYGTTQEDFAEISVVTREWATLNPRRGDVSQGGRGRRAGAAGRGPGRRQEGAPVRAGRSRSTR